MNIPVPTNLHVLIHQLNITVLSKLCIQHQQVPIFVITLVYTSMHWSILQDIIMGSSITAM